MALQISMRIHRMSSHTVGNRMDIPFYKTIQKLLLMNKFSLRRCLQFELRFSALMAVDVYILILWLAETID